MLWIIISIFILKKWVLEHFRWPFYDDVIYIDYLFYLWSNKELKKIAKDVILMWITSSHLLSFTFSLKNNEDWNRRANLSRQLEKKGENFDLARTRTWNLLLRRQTRYPLRHKAWETFCFRLIEIWPSVSYY